MNENVFMISAIFYAMFATIVMIIAPAKKRRDKITQTQKMTTQYRRCLERKRNRKRF